MVGLAALDTILSDFRAKRAKCAPRTAKELVPVILRSFETQHLIVDARDLSQESAASLAEARNWIAKKVEAMEDGMQKRILLQRLGYRLPQREAARRLGLSLSAYHARLTEAVQALRGELAN